MPMKIDGIDYTPEGIESIRVKLIEYRDKAFNDWPEGIEKTVVYTHAIALLAYLKEVEDGADNVDAQRT